MPESLTLFEAQLQEPEVHRFAGMQLAVYSNRAPDKDTANEDSVGVFAAGPRQAVLAVADGAGGQRAGAQASATAIGALRDALTDPEEDRRATILNAIDEANNTICAQGAGAATTLAVIELTNGKFRPYHVGDSAILVTGQRGRIVMQTISHSPVGYAVESGLLDEKEALYHEDRHLVSNMLGMPDMRVEVGAFHELAKRDTLLIASDGLTDNLHMDEIIDIIRRGSLERAAQTLIDRVQRCMQDPAVEGKPDDLSLILMRRALK